MDLSAPVAYNGITFQPASAAPTGAPRSGYEIKNIDYTRVQTDAYYDPRALTDGLDTGDVFLRGRFIEIDAAVYGTSEGHVWDQTQALLAAFSPTLAYAEDPDNFGLLPFTFRQPTIDTATWTAGYIPLQFNARPLEPPTFNVNNMRTNGSGGRGFTLPVNARLIAPSPMKVHQSEITQTLTTSAQVFTYRGDYPAWPWVRLDVDAGVAGTTAIRSSQFNVYLDFSSLATDKRLVVDFEKRAVYEADRGSGFVSDTRNEFILSTSEWGQFGVSALQSVYIQSLTGITLPKFHYREAWA